MWFFEEVGYWLMAGAVFTIGAELVHEGRRRWADRHYKCADCRRPGRRCACCGVDPRNWDEVMARRSEVRP
jgi:hypothetical protein